MTRIRKLGVTAYVITFLAICAPIDVYADTTAPTVEHSTPGIVYSPDIQISITIVDDTELAYVGFGAETSPLSNISMQTVSPGESTVVLQRSLSGLIEGENRFLVIAQDTSGNLVKTPIVITYLLDQSAPQTGSTTLSGAVAAGKFDGWKVSFSNADTITLNGPQYTIVLDQNFQGVGCIGSTGTLTIPVTDFGAGATSFNVVIAAKLVGAVNYTVYISATGVETPILSGAYAIFSIFKLDDFSDSYLSRVIGDTTAIIASCQ